MSDEEQKERYFGSVRFFKHLILTIVALAVLIPVCLAIFFSVRSHGYKHENNSLLSENQSLKEQQSDSDLELSKLQKQLDQLEDKMAQEENDISTQTVSMDPETDWRLILVNNSCPLQQEFTVSLSPVYGKQEVDYRVAASLTNMLNAMRSDGLDPVVNSSYRDFEKQHTLFTQHMDEKLSSGLSYEEAFYEVCSYIEPPGYSEHHTGLAVDIVGKSHQTLDDEQADTAEAIWLADHCFEYGFILRYPKGKEDITGMHYESWHFRYVGVEAATYISQHGITLEEFLDILNDEE